VFDTQQETGGLDDRPGRREATAAHWYAVPMEDGADGSPFDPEPITQLVHRLTRLITGDQLLDLIAAELQGCAEAEPACQA
jgi:hypothetical protein